MIVKIQEIQSVRKSLAARGGPDNALKQFALVAHWINALCTAESRLLEIGCGDGTLNGLLTCRYSGIDPIRHHNLSNQIDFKIGLGESIPYGARAFDYVLIKDAINYFSDLGPIIDEAFRVLTDDGGVLITEFVGARYNPTKQKIKNFVKARLRIRRNIWDSTYQNFYTSDEIIRAAAFKGHSAEYAYEKADCRYYVIIRKRSNAER